VSRSLREYLPLALAAGAFAALVVVAVLVFQTGKDIDQPRRLAEPAPATTPAGNRAAQPDDGAAIMSLHDAPRELPELRFTDGSGKPISLADFRGKLILLNLWATWCGPCREEMPTLDRLQSALGGPDFEVVALSIDRAGIGVVDAFYTEIGINNLARYIDESGKVAQQLNALGLPTTLLLDREGREIARHVGPAEWDTPGMRAFFRPLLFRESGALRPHDAMKRAGVQTIRAAAAFTAPLALRIANKQENAS
jgi:thiol-disulfide isomerase/thioredoxin